MLTVLALVGSWYRYVEGMEPGKVARWRLRAGPSENVWGVCVLAEWSSTRLHEVDGWLVKLVPFTPS